MNPTLSISRESLAKMIDHSILKPPFGREETVAGIQLALEYGVAAVSVKPWLVSLAADMVRGSGVLVDAVVGFPHGGETSATKAFQTAEAIASGAGEIDMVANVGALIGGEINLVREDIAAVVRAAAGAPVKVILEVGYLSDPQITAGCRLAQQAGAAFVKTSTGFGPSGYTLEILRLMRACVDPSVQVKAAQGVHTYKDVLEAIEAGAARVGTSDTRAIMLGWEASAETTTKVRV